MHTTLEAGKPRKFSRLGFSGQTMSYPLGRLFGMLVGEQNSGKSYLFQSNPDAFIINLDESGVVHPSCPATIWPGVNPDGRSIDIDNKPLTLSWAAVEEKRKILLDLAARNEPRPTTVVIDTLMAAIRLLKPHIASQLGRDSFEQAHGPAAWDRLYETLVEFCMSLRQAGYGVWIVAHLSRRWVSLSDTAAVEELRLSMSEGLKDRLSRMVEIIAPMRCDTSTTTIQEQITTTIAGKPVTRTIPKIVQRHARALIFDDPAYTRLVRTRTLRRMPNIPLDGPTPWADFERAFSEANTPENPIHTS